MFITLYIKIRRFGMPIRDIFTNVSNEVEVSNYRQTYSLEQWEKLCKIWKLTIQSKFKNSKEN